MIPMEVKTEQGIRYFRNGFIIFIFSLVFALIVLIVMIPTIIEVVQGGEPDFVEALRAVIIIIAMACLHYIVWFISLIIFLVGILYLHWGKDEFGKDHSDSVQRGLIFIIIGCVIGISLGSVADAVWDQRGGAIVGIFVTAFLSMGVVHLIYQISDEKTKRLLWTAAFTWIAIKVAVAAFTIWIYNSLDMSDITSDFTDIEEYLTVAFIPYAVGSLTIIPMVIFYIAYNRTYTRVLKREIMPVPRPVLPFPAYPPPPPPYAPIYPPPMYPPPSYPPPAYPPPGQQNYYPPGPATPLAPAPPPQVPARPEQRGRRKPGEPL